VHRRVSRTDLDFEQALRAEGTVLLKEGPDVNAMGADISYSTIDTTFSSPKFTPNRRIQTTTPTIVPPTPSATAGPSSSIGGGSSSRSSSSHDVFYDAEDAERQINRRSLYRSPGTSSSPDLTTMMRKAKERGGVVPPHLVKSQKRRESPPPPMPKSSPSLERPTTSSGRPRSSTSYSVSPPPPSGPRGKPISYVPDTSMTSEWVLPSPHPVKETNTAKVSPFLALIRHLVDKAMKIPKSSIRNKTSTFLGKMLGQGGTGSVRERSVRISSTSVLGPSDTLFLIQKPETPVLPTPSAYSSQSTIESAPPVPPIPTEYQRGAVSPTNESLSASQRAILDSKPLPPVKGTPRKGHSDDIDDRSMVFVDKIIPPEFTHNRAPDTPTSIKAAKRRSMSVGEAELKKAMLASSLSAAPPPIIDKKHITAQHPGDTTLNNILDDFKGELSQLDPVQKSILDLRDPSTPARRAARSKIDTTVFDSTPRELERSPSQTSPVLSLQIPSHSLEDSPQKLLSSPIVPPRTASLQKARPTSRPSSIGPQYAISPRHASSPLRSRAGPSNLQTYTTSREASRLRSLHRSTASSSEPSLIPVGDDAHACQCTIFFSFSSHLPLCLTSPCLRYGCTRVNGE
jgi:PH/SEC7 domain-containing protein